MREFTCLRCFKKFYSEKFYKERTPKYCSRSCFSKRSVSQETRKKQSEAKKGYIPWNKGTKKEKVPHPRQILRKIEFICHQCEVQFIDKSACKSRTPKFCSRKCFGLSIKKNKFCPICSNHVSWVNSKYCSRKCQIVGKTGTKMTLESKIKMSKVRKGNPKFSGSNCHSWKGGVTPAHIKIRKSSEYSNWRLSVFERDDYTCQFCKVRGGILHADHILPFSAYPDLRLDITNGRTLCLNCHKKTDTYGYKSKRNFPLNPDIC